MSLENGWTLYPEGIGNRIAKNKSTEVASFEDVIVIEGEEIEVAKRAAEATRIAREEAGFENLDFSAIRPNR
ncbi:hypothetical protein H0V99_03385 [Candidatus Saccharibacteria bacterium]|nr:hypothetical protein [Candidatus Saccharibacteria bacterium]